uniref:Centrosomal protein of 126 kDa n=2 Tax=Castor canadensis TaxID=51338 RepID=A0A8B7UWB0_CASCN|nr:centrosomal protein of 126 kDa [Castor canadensis]
MLAGRPGAQSAVLGRESSDALGLNPVGHRESGARHRPGAYLDMKIHLEKNLEVERQILLQQQKICRNRARKYFVESNRRKKVFEDKRKEQEEREHQIREQILQQRKQKFEEVTEKFQRAHIPLSRRRAVFQKPVPPLEEALKQIQESNLKSEVNLPFSHRSTINWRAVDSALPSESSKSDHKHQQHFLSKINCDKEMKENNMTLLTTKKNVFQLKLEETQKLLEDQHLSSLQKFCDEVNQITNSETLSSLDSLEAGEREELYLTLSHEPPVSVQQDCISVKAANLQSTNVNYLDENKLSFSKAQHINNWLMNLDAQNTQSVTSFSDILSKPSVLPSWERFNNTEQNSSTLSRTVETATGTSSNSVAFVYSSPIVALDKKKEKTSETSTVRTGKSTSGALEREKFSKAWTTPHPLTQDVTTVSYQETSELTPENRTTSIPTSFVPMATSLVLPSNPQSARPIAMNNILLKEIDPVQCSDKLDELEDVKDEKIRYFNCNKEELPLFSDSIQAACVLQNPDSKEKNGKIAETSSSHVISNYDLLDQRTKMKYNIHERNGVRFLKSILKKESKYEHSYLQALIINQGFKFRNQKAAAIRDSIELTKEKEKGAETPKTIKKLRWFDETGDTEHSSVENRTGRTQRWSQQSHLKNGARGSMASVPACADRKNPKAESSSENATDSGGIGTAPVPLNCFIPSGYNLTKQAWPASKKEESKVHVHDGDSKRGAPHRGGAKVSRRTGSAKVHPGFLDVNRRGPIQPQSASRANALAQIQGKVIIPHPLPKSTPNIRSSKSIQMSQCQFTMPESSQNIITHSCFNSKFMLPTEPSMNLWMQESGPPCSDACSDLVTVMPSPLSVSSECQTLAKSNHFSSAQMFAPQDGMLYCTQRSPVYEESYQSVHLRNTKEELVPSWKRENNTLCQNARATDSTVTRRKRIVENKRRNLLEQKRKNPGSVGQKYNEQTINFGQNVQLSSTEPKQTTGSTYNMEEVSDSISEFLMAENLLKASVPEDEILTVLNSKQLQKPSLALNKTQQLNICALSTEEQKILQSLNHLNERLHCKWKDGFVGNTVFCT